LDLDFVIISGKRRNDKRFDENLCIAQIIVGEFSLLAIALREISAYWIFDLTIQYLLEFDYKAQILLLQSPFYGRCPKQYKLIS
jgi:hypothetical protein